MDVRNFMGHYLFAVTVVVLSFQLFLYKTQEWSCEQIYNVYDCEQDPEWYPVYGEELEEEIMP